MTSLQKLFLIGIVFIHIVIGVWMISSSNNKESVHTNGQIEVFVRNNCTHCAALEEYFSKKNITVNTYNIATHREKFLQVTEDFDLFAGTPLILSGNTLFSGYADDETGDKIIKAQQESSQQYTFDEALQSPENIQTSIGGASCGDSNTEEKEASEDCAIPVQTIDIPWYGTLVVQEISTITKYGISFVIGFLDGFNPCAMWVLIVFIMTLMQIGDRTKMAFVAGTFLIAESVMYGGILVLWWQFFGTLSAWGFDMWMQLAVGALAVGAGLFFLYEGFFTDGTCQVTDMKQQKTISDKISNIASSPISWAMFAGILMLAFSVNVIEFACSAGYPQLFTSQILGAEGNSILDKTGFLLTYLGAYMLDDVVVFVIALVAIEKLGILQKYGKGFNIFGGIAMLIIGELMIFFPQILKAIF